MKITTERERSSVRYVAARMYGKVHEDLSRPKVVLHPGGTFLCLQDLRSNRPARHHLAFRILFPSSHVNQKTKLDFDPIQERMLAFGWVLEMAVIKWG